MSMLEEELYIPVKKYFERRGFQVKGEVKNCDIAGVKGDVLLIVELKRNFNLKLIYQAMERQKITNHVYVAIPRPKNFRKKEVKRMIELLKRLNIGLIVVNFGEKRTLVQTILQPESEKFVPKTNIGKNYILKEFNERSGDFNTGGKTRTKIVTAYREKSIEIACFLERLVKGSGAELKKLGCDKYSTSIMYNNFYGWFHKIGRGAYILSEKGRLYLDGNEFTDIIEFYRKEAEEKCLKYQETTDAGAEAVKSTKYATKEVTRKN